MDTSTVVERSAGGGRCGRKQVGFTTASSAGPSTRASIPSKFETILHADNREADGFGNRTFRFSAGEDDRPGPGAYTRDDVEDTRHRLSVSKRGTSSFAGPMRPTPQSKTPGPCSYDVPVASTTGVTSVFSPPVSRRPPPSPTVHAPGLPQCGDGAPAKKTTGGHIGRCARGIELPARDLAARSPGEFQSGRAFNFAHGGSRAPCSFAASRTARFSAPPSAKSAVPSLPPALNETSRSINAHIRDAVAELGGRPLGQRSGKKPQRAPQPSSFFAVSGTDRFGRTTVQYTASDDAVGPGEYGASKEPPRKLISSSWALSAVPRGEAKERYAVPGPAYYGSSPPQKKVSHRVQAGPWA